MSYKYGSPYSGSAAPNAGYLPSVSPSPTPSPRYGYYYPAPPRPATRAHSRHFSNGGHDDYRAAFLPNFSPRFTSTGEYGTGGPSRTPGMNSRMPSFSASRQVPKREHCSSYSYRTPHVESDEDEYIEVDGVTYVLPAQSRITVPPAHPQTTRRPSGTRKHAAPPVPRSIEVDSRKYEIPRGYSLKNWDPTEEPILLLGSVFDANCLGKWIYDWTTYRHGESNPISDMSGELWKLLIQLSGKIKCPEDIEGIEGTISRIRVKKDHEGKWTCDLGTEPSLETGNDPPDQRTTPIENMEKTGDNIGNCDGNNDTFCRPHNRHGRGKRKNTAYWKARDNNPEAGGFHKRELLFADRHGSLKVNRLAMCDTGLSMDQDTGSDTLMSARCAKSLRLMDEISDEFVDPGLQSLTGQATPVLGVLRDVPFRLRGTSVTLCHDFLVTDVLDNVADIVLGVRFIEQHLGLVLGPNVLARHMDQFWGGSRKSTIAIWYPKKKESPEEEERRKKEEEQQRIKAQEQEAKRQQRERERNGQASGP